ncbi:unnamed protein product [Caenorhabditis nigoni]
MKTFVVYVAVLLVVISLFGVQGQPNNEPEHYPNVPVGDDSVMNVHIGERISHLASNFFMDGYAHRRRRMSTTTRKPKTG